MRQAPSCHAPALGRVLSLSTWRDEKAVIRWRTLAVHHEVQEKGRFEVFADYHLRVGEIIEDTDVPPGQDLRQQRFDSTEVGEAQVVSITEIQPVNPEAPTDVTAFLTEQPHGVEGLVDLERYDSIYTKGKVLWLAAWRDEAALEAWLKHHPQAVQGPVEATMRRRTVRIIRDYGMFDRREAPQYYPPVERRT
jgi:heme-degrading monooxygenase HmoA